MLVSIPCVIPVYSNYCLHVIVNSWRDIGYKMTKLCVMCIVHIDANAVDIKTEADRNDITEMAYPQDDMPNAGMFGIYFDTWEPMNDELLFLAWYNFNAILQRLFN